MASLLATLVLDKEAMDALQARGDGPPMFRTTLRQLARTMQRLKESRAAAAGGLQRTASNMSASTMGAGSSLSGARVPRASGGAAHASANGATGGLDYRGEAGWAMQAQLTWVPVCLPPGPCQHTLLFMGHDSA